VSLFFEYQCGIRKCFFSPSAILREISFSEYPILALEQTCDTDTGSNRSNGDPLVFLSEKILLLHYYYILYMAQDPMI
jgi:hypothetical protein